MAALVYLLIGLVLSGGVLLLIAGEPWLLVIALLAYVVAFSRTCWQSQHCRTRCENLGVRRHVGALKTVTCHRTPNLIHFDGTGNFCCMADWICAQGRQPAPFVPAATPVA